MKKINIDSKGYGKIYKAVTRNPALPLIAKAIYAYLCSYAGKGTTAFPSRDKMTRDLQINKDTCTKHLNTLVAQGYLKKQRTTTNNLYTIIQEIPLENKDYDKIDGGSDLLVFKNIGYRGYGTVPKLVMLDRRLTAQAKAIYAYFASFAGSGDTAFPRRATILRELKISAPTYYKHYQLLIEYGYITSEQKTVNGRYDVCIYELQTEIDTPEKTSFSYPMSEKVKHGENALDKADSSPMSEKLVHGETDVENSPIEGPPMSEKPMSEKLVSEKVVSEKTVHSNLGRTNNNNIPYKKHSCNEQIDKEQSYNQIKEKRCGKPTLAKIKKWIDYDQHLLDMKATPSLRTLFGHSDGGIEDLQYMSKYKQVVSALPECINELIDAFDLCTLLEESVLAEIFDYEPIREIIDRIMDKCEEIARAEAYLKTSLENYIKTLVV